MWYYMEVKYGPPQLEKFMLVLILVVRMMVVVVLMVEVIMVVSAPHNISSERITSARGSQENYHS